MGCSGSKSRASRSKTGDSSLSPVNHTTRIAQNQVCDMTDDEATYHSADGGNESDAWDDADFDQEDPCCEPEQYGGRSVTANSIGLPLVKSEVECRAACVQEGLEYELNIGAPRIGPQHVELIQQVRAQLPEALKDEHKAYLSDATVYRFLKARGEKVEAATAMLTEALQWRSVRHPEDCRASEFIQEGETGKITRPGWDRWGRPLMVFNNAAQNTSDSEAHMRFLCWNMEECERAAGMNGSSKYCLLINLEEFSMFNNPPMSETKEACYMVCTAYPERLGSCVIYRPPWIFKQASRSHSTHDAPTVTVTVTSP